MEEKKFGWEDAVANVNEVLKLEPAIPAEDEMDSLANLIERQGTEDAFVDEDYLPKDGFGLKDMTVKYLIGNEVPVPASWANRLEAQFSKVKPAAKKEEPAKKTEKKKVEPKKATRSKISDFLAILEPELESGITRDGVSKLVKDSGLEIPDKTIRVILSWCKNPKYNRLPKLVVEKDGKLIFGESVE